MKLATALIATTTLLALPTTALASSKTAQNINACKTEIQTQLGADADALNMDFKKVRGNTRLQKLNFVVDLNGTRDRLTCNVSRDASIEIKWGDDVKPVATRVVEADADTSTTAGE